MNSGRTKSRRPRAPLEVPGATREAPNKIVFVSIPRNIEGAGELSWLSNQRYSSHFDGFILRGIHPVSAISHCVCDVRAAAY
eukprot:5196822-Prymnesium_polylepis.1